MPRCFVGLVLAGVLAAPALAQNLDDVIIPRKTDIFIVLQRTLNTRTTSVGDKFSALVEVPITQNDQIIVPPGSFIIGHVAETKRSGRIRGKGRLLLAFDTVILPEGTTRNLQAVVQSTEGYGTDPGNETGELEAPGSQAGEVAGTAAGGAVTGTIIGATAGSIRGGTWRGAGIGAAAGAATGALIGLLQRGEDVELPKGTSLTIQLTDDVQFVKPKPPPPVGRALGP